jgi:hypothetical protein
MSLALAAFFFSTLASLDWVYLLGGLALGLVPPKFFYPRACRHLDPTEARVAWLQNLSRRGSRSRSRRGAANGVASGEVAKSSSTKSRKKNIVWLYFIDPVRGYFSAHLLALGLASIPQNDSAETMVVVLLQILIIFGVLSVQMEFGRQRVGKLLAPVCFMVGFISGLYLDFAWAGVSVSVLTIVAILATQKLGAGYVVGGVAAAAVCYPFFGPSPATVVFALTASAPVLYAFMRRAPLTIPVLQNG